MIDEDYNINFVLHLLKKKVETRKANKGIN
jgi:hypothetical protein